MKIDWKDKKTWIIIGAAVIVIALVVWLIVRKKNKVKIETDDDGNAEVSGQNAVLQTSATFPLRPSSAGLYSAATGSYGKEIVVLQMIYNKMCTATSGLTLDVDGKYGNETFTALYAYFPGCMTTDGTITEANYNNILSMYRGQGYGEITFNTKG